jgi:carbon monoxide dehydrogenase subunit G
VAAGAEQAWRLLADVRAVGACMPGARITGQVSDTLYKGEVTCRIGPAVVRLHGEIEVLALDHAARTLKMRGRGTDLAGASAQFALDARIEPDAARPTGCALVGRATITVGGALAQFGDWLLLPLSDAILAQFGDNFRAVATAAAASSDASSAASPVTATDASSPAPPARAGALPPHRELNALSLLWSAVKPQVAGLFGKRR